MRKILISTILLLLFVSVANAESIFKDDFEDGNSEGWFEIVDDWKVRDGTYCTDMVGGTTGSTGLAMAGNKGWSDYTFKFDVTPNFGTGIGIYIMAQEPRAFNFNGYAADVGVNGKVTLIRYINGAPTDLIKEFKPEFNVQTGKSYTIKYQKLDNKLRLKIWEKGTPEPNWQIQTEDTTYSKGLVGIGTWNSKICIDNIEVDGILLDSGGDIEKREAEKKQVRVIDKITVEQLTDDKVPQGIVAVSEDYILIKENF